MKSLTVSLASPTVPAIEVHDKLGVSTRYDMWFGRMVEKYGFTDGVDFCTILCKSSGGRRKTEHHVTIGMAKELCMLDNSEVGREVRKAYIALENSVRKKEIVRLAGIEARKGLTDRIKESGENERMHGFGYSQYTKLAYKFCGIEYVKTSDFRSTLSAEDLSRVETVEKMMDALISLGKHYDEIKHTLAKIIPDKKQLEET